MINLHFLSTRPAAAQATDDLLSTGLDRVPTCQQLLILTIYCISIYQMWKMQHEFNHGKIHSDFQNAIRSIFIEDLSRLLASYLLT